VKKYPSATDRTCNI